MVKCVAFVVSGRHGFWERCFFESEQQIPSGMTSKKGKSKSNSSRNRNSRSPSGMTNKKGKCKGWRGKGILFHPCRGEAAPWMGHPVVFGG